MPDTISLLGIEIFNWQLILIIIGIGLLLSWVWGANIGGLITAASVAVHLLLQRSVGHIRQARPQWLQPASTAAARLNRTRRTRRLWVILGGYAERCASLSAASALPCALVGD